MKSFWLLDRNELAFCLAALILFFGIAAYATRSGPGVSPDSTGYMRVAESLLAGRGFVLTPAEHTLNKVDIPFTSQPPLFPLVLAAFAWLWRGGSQGIDAAARWLPIFCSCIAVFPLYWLGRSMAGRWAGVFAVLAVIGFHNYIWLASYAWSDTFFILLVALVLSLMVALSQHKADTGLPLSGLCALSVGVGLLNLTRTVGFFVFAAGFVLFLQVMLRAGWRKALLPPLLYTVTYVGMVAPWYMRNLRLSGTFSGYPYVTDRVHLTLKDSLVTLVTTVAADLAPRLHLGFKENSLALLLLATVALGLSSVLIVQTWRGAKQRTWITAIIGWQGWPVLVYIAASLGGLTLIGGTVQIFPGEWSRYLGAVYPFVLLLGVVLLFRLWLRFIANLPATQAVSTWATRIAFTLLLVIWLIGYAQSMFGFSLAAAKGQQFTAPDWVNSAGIAYIQNKIPTDAIIYSDRPEIIWYWTKRHTVYTPLASYGEVGLQKMLHEVGQRTQVQYIVVFTDEHHGAFRVTHTDILKADQQQMLEIVTELEDAIVLKMRQ